MTTLILMLLLQGAFSPPPEQATTEIRETEQRAQFGEAEGAEKERPAKKICRTYPVTGSRSKKTRVCHTPDQWKRLYEQNQIDNQNGLNRTGVCTGGPACNGN